MNHVQCPFGQPLVPSVFDFGRNGRPPSHPALVDWLACELSDPGMSSNPKSEIRNPKLGDPKSKWSMKRLHRLIVTSATYRQASTFDPACAAVDRDNVYLWRIPARRLEAEVVRDNALYVAGQLDLRHSGADIDYHLGMTVFRRSLYFRHAAEKEMEFLKLFDAASVTECYQRKESIIPQQALALFNSELTIRMSRHLARELAKRIPRASTSSPRHLNDAVAPANFRRARRVLGISGIAAHRPCRNGNDATPHRRGWPPTRIRSGTAGTREFGSGVVEPPRICHGSVTK